MPFFIQRTATLWRHVVAGSANRRRRGAAAHTYRAISDASSGRILSGMRTVVPPGRDSAGVFARSFFSSPGTEKAASEEGENKGDDENKPKNPRDKPSFVPTEDVPSPFYRRKVQMVRDPNVKIASSELIQQTGLADADGGKGVGVDVGPKFDDENHPRRIQERKDMIVLMLALEFTSLRDKSENKSKSRDEIIDEAIENLQKREIDDMSLVQVRVAIQEALHDPAVNLICAMAKVDAELPPMLGPDEEGFDNTEQQKIREKYRNMLQKELEETNAKLQEKTFMQLAPKGAAPQIFLKLKRDALKKLLDYEYKSPHKDSEGEDLENESEKQRAARADAFGYIESKNNPERNDLIRYFQTINMYRSSAFRKEVGYSVISLKSSILGAGRGVFVDGFAPAGSILAFQPGFVWTKEDMGKLTVEEDLYFEQNNKLQLSMRHDHYLIDSRSSPYTVLNGDDHHNLMAIAHIVNHPKASQQPNCKSLFFNFTTSMGPATQKGATEAFDWKKYVPNQYAKPQRKKGILDSLMNKDGKAAAAFASLATSPTEMQSMCLVASRDICDEELLYDYRLMAHSYPGWYFPVEETEFIDDGLMDEGDEDNDNQ